ncbi:OmpP1/FadL family transporter [Massilia sp. erpn]|uniref:OmpP1/FadL family transporter n=1 Tax=Massilia sp. erpn TaxID=2738142 RepID=UPI0021068C27|nr:OmpP1/FadL family transporter [Massilia sp. erpn]UTY60516.1 transporter [Massilia sp. erpn]
MNKNTLSLIIAAALAAASMNAAASGYRFGSQSVGAQGTADANGAEAADASTIFSNAAGLSRLQGTQATGGLTVVVPHSTFADSGSKRFTGTSTGGQQTQGDYAPNAVAAPSFYLSHQLNQQWTVGMGMFVPYGTKIDYDNNWSGRYALTNIKLESITLNPSASFKLNEQHAFGFGISAEFMKAKLGQGVDVPGSIMALRGNPAGAAMIQQIIAGGGNPAALGTAQDGHATMNGKDWGFGFNVGYLFSLDKDTRFGIAYRSSISHKLKGGATWDFSSVTADPVANKVLQAASRKKNSPALVELRTPETLSVNAFHQFNDKWAGMADVTWTRHSRLKDLNIQFVDTGEGDEVIRQNWKNTWRVSLGANYKFDDKLTLRGGIAHDQAPVRSDELRHAALPDSDRNQLSLGLNYKLTPKSSIDLAYSYLAFKDGNTNYRNTCSPLMHNCTGNGELTKGTYQTHLQLLGVAYNHQF